MINKKIVLELIKKALEEDLGDRGDITTLSVISESKQAQANFLIKEDAVCVGLEIVAEVFKQIDKKLIFTPLVKDGDFCKKGKIIAKVSGSARAILSSERIALNFIQRLSGIASETKKYVDLLGNSKTKILDTRKTTPAYRYLEKYAVKMGGGENHRFGLYDRIMIKDNHRELNFSKSKGITDIPTMVKICRKKYPDVEIEVEVDTLEECKSAVESQVDYILLDNMTNEQMKKAIDINNGLAKLEASGGITLERISSLGKLGLDYISVGALTHSVKSIDISLDISK